VTSQPAKHHLGTSMIDSCTDNDITRYMLTGVGKYHTSPVSHSGSAAADRPVPVKWRVDCVSKWLCDEGSLSLETLQPLQHPQRLHWPKLLKLRQQRWKEVPRMQHVIIIYNHLHLEKCLMKPEKRGFAYYQVLCTATSQRHPHSSTSGWGPTVQ